MEERGREAVPLELRGYLKEMFKRHYNSHPFIPDSNGVKHSAEEIHTQATREAYEWRRMHNLPRLWAYLFVNWYKADQWKLWATSGNSSEVPVLRPTMILESHCAKLKYQYLPNFNRPSIDLVVWTLTSRVIPDATHRLQALATGNRRIATASWRKHFKKERKTLAARGCEREKQLRYHMYPTSWVCGCASYLNSRFMLCKNLIGACRPIENNVEFFSEICRQRRPPFWVHPQLIPNPEFQHFAERI